MQRRNMILIATGVAVALSLVMLVARTGGTPSTAIPEDKVEAARQRYERAQRMASRRSELVQPRVTSRPAMKRVDPTAEARTTADTRDDQASGAALRPRGRGTAALQNAWDSKNPSDESSEDKGDLDTRMAEANQFYDRRDYESALAAAKEILAENPGNIRMLRVVVSSSCIMGEEDAARESYAQLPERHQRQMRRRCERYGIELGESE